MQARRACFGRGLDQGPEKVNEKNSNNAYIMICIAKEEKKRCNQYNIKHNSDRNAYKEQVSILKCAGVLGLH